MADDEGKYDLSNVERERENADIKQVKEGMAKLYKEGMAKLTADLALIENGIAVKCKRGALINKLVLTLKTIKCM